MEMKNEIGELIDDNRLLENELRNLGEKTNNKISDMQKKMENNVRELDMVKGKNETEIRTLAENTKEKLDRINEDFIKRMDMMKDKLEEAMQEKQDSEFELDRLKEVKRKEQANMELDLKKKKERFFDDSWNQFNTVIKVLNNNIRQAEEDKRIKAMKLEELKNETDLIRKEFENELNLRQDQDEQLREEIKKMRQDIADKEAEIENYRSELYDLDSQLQRMNGELQKNKFELNQSKEKGEYNLRELGGRFNMEREEEQAKEKLLVQKNQELTHELKIIEEKVRQQEQLNQKTMESMRSQLNQNIFQTINQHKESRLNVPMNKHVSRGGSFFMNNNP
jgi:chromosome segregation ATPase